MRSAKVAALVIGGGLWLWGFLAQPSIESLAFYSIVSALMVAVTFVVCGQKSKAEMKQ